MKYISIILTTITLTFTLSCSAVFSATSIEGSLKDKEEYDNDRSTGNIENAEVYLYLDEDLRDEDFTNFNSDNLTPADRETTNYSDFSLSDQDGNYTFNSMYWESLFPKYGKTADALEVYILVYHPDYGLVKNSNPVYILSDISNVIPTFFLSDIVEKATLEGYVTRWKGSSSNAAQDLANVTVDIYVADSWSYSTGTTIDDSSIKYPKEPTLSVTTDADGYYTATISYTDKGKSSSDSSAVPVAIKYDLDDYMANDATDSDLTSVDIDDDGVAEFLLKDQKLTQDKLKVLPEIELKQVNFTTSLSGILEDGSGNGLSNKTINITISTTEGDKTYSTTTETVNISDSTDEKGHFNFNNIQWYDDAYTNDYSSVTITFTKDVNEAAVTSQSITFIRSDKDNSATVVY